MSFQKTIPLQSYVCMILRSAQVLCLALLLTGDILAVTPEGRLADPGIRLTNVNDPNELSLQTQPFALVLLRDEIDNAIMGQRCVFPITVIDEGIGEGTGEPVLLSIDTLGQGPADVNVSIEPNEIRPGEVAELTIIPLKLDDPDPNRLLPPVEDDLGGLIVPEDPEQEQDVFVNLHAMRGKVRRTRLIEVSVLPGEDHLAETAARYRDLFVPWLAEHHPELGITEQTEWVGTIVRPRILIVMYYLFFSSEWEMGVRWHVMIPPYDWAEIYLRRRGELSSTWAWRIHSVEGQLEPEIVELPVEGIFR